MLFWGELGVGAGGPGAGPPPARPFGKQDAADLAAAHADALGLGGLGEGVQGPVRRRLGLGGASSPSPPWCSRPGGAERARAMIRPRSVSLSRRGRPGPGRSPSPSTPSALNRCSRSRTVWGWQPSWSAIWVVPRPSQLWAIIRARRIQSPGACRAPASLRMVRSSAASSGGRANSRTGTAAPPRRAPSRNRLCGHTTYTPIEERSTSHSLLGTATTSGELWSELVDEPLA